MSGTFAAQGAYGSYEQAQQLHDVWNRSDVSREQKIEMGTGLVLNTLMAGTAALHAGHSALTPDHPVLTGIPEQDRSRVADRVNTLVATERPLLPIQIP